MADDQQENRIDNREVFEKGLSSAAQVRPRVVAPATTEPKPVKVAPKKD